MAQPYPKTIMETKDTFTQFLVSWPKDFSTSRSSAYRGQDKPYVEFLADMFYSYDDDGEEDEEDCDEFIDEKGSDEDGNEETGEKASESDLATIEGHEVTGADQNNSKPVECSNTQDNILFFMKGMIGDEDALPYADQVDQVSGVSQEGIDEASKPIALLDDRSQLEGSRPYLGPLTVDGLRETLLQKRFRDESGEDAINVFDDKGSDVQRRIIFVTDLNPRSIEALALTASKSQAHALKDMFYKNLMRKPSIGVTIPSHGFLTYTLDFHIPYFVLKKDETRKIDTRMNFSGKPLRQSSCLPFLGPLKPSTSTNNNTYCLYEAQTSVCVTGIDHLVWTAYGFVDTYFGCKESVDYYDRMKGPTGRPDPLGAGQIPANNLIWTSREYFFKIFEIRINEVRRHWRSIVTIMGESIQESKPPPLSNDPETIKKVRDYSIWCGEMVPVLNQLTDCLSGSVKSWDEFWRRDLMYFLHNEDGSQITRSLRSSINLVDKAFSDLTGELQKLKDMKEELCAASPQGVNAHLSFGNQEATLHQQKSSGNIQTLTVLTIMLSPLGIATAMFSTQGVLPFTPTFGRFAFTVILLALLVLGLLVLLNWDSWILPVVNYLIPDRNFCKVISMQQIDHDDRKARTWPTFFKRTNWRPSRAGLKEDIETGPRTWQEDQDHG